MKYYLLEITNYVDGTAESKGVYTYDSKDLAIANFHSKMGGAMKNENYLSELVCVYASEGQSVKREYYEKAIDTVTVDA